MFYFLFCFRSPESSSSAGVYNICSSCQCLLCLCVSAGPPGYRWRDYGALAIIMAGMAFGFHHLYRVSLLHDLKRTRDFKKKSGGGNRSADPGFLFYTFLFFKFQGSRARFVGNLPAWRERLRVYHPVCFASCMSMS